jgi:hypothetical protein
MTNIKYQNYLHYKLPITINPLEYGKLIEQFGNKYVIQLNTTNIVVIKEMDNENFIKFFRRGDLMFDYKDFKQNQFRFIRTIQNQRYTFEKNKLISTEILNALISNLMIYHLYKDTNSILSKITPLSFFMIVFQSMLIIVILKSHYLELGILTSFIPGISIYNKKNKIQLN